MSKYDGGEKYNSLILKLGLPGRPIEASPLISPLWDLSITSDTTFNSSRKSRLSDAVWAFVKRNENAAIRWESIRWRPLTLIIDALVFSDLIFSCKIKKLARDITPNKPKAKIYRRVI
ncbi:MAG: hypothetical protein A2879_05760 [Omnitrophica WOR_2 bacterium RIFCSPHIGHO2_01_FULL_49_10]|nr:MAG: hypothetical protein A2879_05760 [Omnitrophica WOR_2 bacterium RIFCSPHIGHO2_01_FULL_49_10]OGX32545.1 MAG: hypothetical protein A3I43_03900 [Omnitrophica WOR_2 bacterium RIFCSPLOWO2_02_FULL_50_19]